MMPTEPLPTAWLLAIVGVLLAASVLLSRVSSRTGIPAVLIFLAIGMLAGSEGPGGLFFEDYALSFRVGTVALALILFDGGLNTPLSSLRRVLLPATSLATVGVVLTAGLLAVGARLVGFAWDEALLLGAIVSSTDAAAVFSVLRGAGLKIRRRIAATLEVESGFNDPIAIVLTIAITQAMLAEGRDLGGAMLRGLYQLAVGGGVGILVGFAASWVMGRVRLPVGGLYPVLSLAAALVGFGLPTILSGSGFLGVYVTGMVIGNRALPYRSGLLRIHDFVGWSSQILMFLTLGLLVFPSRLASAAPAGLAVAFWLIVLARPLAVAMCLAPFRYSLREIVYVGWVGLRGAVPIILATFPVMAGVPGAKGIFDIVFFVVVVSVLLQGTTVRWLTRRLGLGVLAPPAPPATLEIVSRQPLRGDLVSYFIHPDSAVAGSRLNENPLPSGATVVMVARGDQLLPPAPDTVLLPGDHAFVIAGPEDRATLQLLFGQPEDG